ncbi:hypothetical protein [Tardiphaga sp. 862_B3_N1_1]|uniref:hypothetical protein n=1 Tax=Tardiphaga sp. 862_B3_N1_1 TaxID=3240763 RepID=UPI003F8CE4BA
MKFIRHMMRSTDLTFLQKVIVTVLIDLTNEGFGDDERKFGLAYPTLENLMVETGSSNGGLNKALDQLAAMDVIRIGAEKAPGAKKRPGGRNVCNRYWLPGWNIFGAVAACEKNSPHIGEFGNDIAPAVDAETLPSERKTVHSERETLHAVGKNSPESGHDSTSLPGLEHNSFTPRQLNGDNGKANARDNDKHARSDSQRAAARDHSVESMRTKDHDLATGKQLQASDNVPTDEERASQRTKWPKDYQQRFWRAYPVKRGDSRKKAFEKLDELRRTGVAWSTLMTGVDLYAKHRHAEIVRDQSNERFTAAAHTWLDDERWETERLIAPPKPKFRYAI